MAEISQRSQQTHWQKQAILAAEMVKTCIQCGTCTGSCPNSEFMDITPRKMWRLLISGRIETLFGSRSFIMCSSCYTCTLRCPRGLDLTCAMGLLKLAASRMDKKPFRRTGRFYKAFMDSVEKHGRVKEMDLMTHFFIAMKNPMVPLSFTPLGVRLLLRGKVHPEFSMGAKDKLSRLFKKTAELEV
jgi:heterodisulfide reductase subunit C